MLRVARHAGDLGNIEEDGNGEVESDITDTYVSLRGTYDIIGRAIVVTKINILWFA